MDLKYWSLASIAYYLLPEIEDENQKNRLETLLPTESLYRQYLHTTCEYADFKGIHQLRRVVQVKLSDIYVPVLLTKLAVLSDKIFEKQDTENSELKAKMVNVNSDKSHEKEGLARIIEKNDSQLELEKAFTLEEGIAPNKRMVILGGPGSGKTTMLRQLTGKLIIDQTSNLFPILVPLRDYVRIKNMFGNVSILDFISKYFISHDLRITNDFLERYLSSGGCVIMFDGLDEILVEQDRIEAATKIEQFAACFGNGNSIIINSRIPSYMLAQLTGFEHYTIQQLDATQISEFVLKWCRQVEGNSNTQNSQALVSTLLRNPNLLSLSTNPLMLSLICLTSLQGIPIPNRKADLYDICIRTLSSSWEAKKGFNGILDEPQRFETIKKLAFSFLEQKKITATEYEVLTLLENILVEQQLSKDDPKTESISIFRAITERSGIWLRESQTLMGLFIMDFATTCPHSA